MINKITTFIKNNKLHVFYIIIILILIIIIAFKFSAGSTKSSPDIQSVTDTTKDAVKDAQEELNVYTSDSDAKDVSNLINKAVSQPATAVYYTGTQQEADNTAKKIAKTDKADYVLKETSTSTDSAATDNNKIQNNYYAISQERKHKIAAGTTIIDSKAYADLSYTNRDLTYTIHSKDLKNIDGVSVEYTIAKW